MAEFSEINPAEVPPWEAQVKEWEYWLQLSLGSMELHLERAWALTTTVKRKDWMAYVKDNIKGPLIGCWVEFEACSMGMGRVFFRKNI